MLQCHRLEKSKYHSDIYSVRQTLLDTRLESRLLNHWPAGRPKINKANCLKYAIWPWCIFCFQFFRPTSQPGVSQSTLQPSVLCNAILTGNISVISEIRENKTLLKYRVESNIFQCMFKPKPVVKQLIPIKLLQSLKWV